ncbi:MAG: MltA domain-containing protein [Bdellovibrionaceae bacterium]|nr:MltA domain-containing protein [Pseudobdellovibrionaceae bacterium]
MKHNVSLTDDLPLKSLVHGIQQSIDKLEKDNDGELRFGPKLVKKSDYAKALKSLLAQILKVETKAEFLSYVRQNFDFYEVYGSKQWGEVFITSYYDPVIQGALKPNKELNQALYKTPSDLVTINIGKYADVFPKWNVFAESVLEQKSRKPIVRGRLLKSKNDNGVPEVVPYLSRQEIDQMQSLKGLGLELVYVSPIDSFFLQIQGSGTVKLPSGKEIRVGYDSQNGHPYVAIGAHLLDAIPLKEMSLQRIEQHLKTLTKEKQQEILNKNPSYVFFRELKGSSQTFFSTDVIPGRTIATDYGIFPKGVLAFLEFEKPIFATKESDEPSSWEKTSRLVFDHDTGGAIRGPARLDLYWGKGPEAKQSAGVMKGWGRLTYLVPKNINEPQRELP